MTTAAASAGAAVEVQENVQWAERVFAAAAVAPVPAARVIVVHEDVAGDTKVGTCAAVERPPLRLGERTYSRGIGVNSRSILRVQLGQASARFLADIGLDRNVDRTPASVTMHVQVDGKDLFATPVLRPDGNVYPIAVPLQGARAFDLVVGVGPDDRSYDQADWCDARVELQDGTELWLDDLARRPEPDRGLPFSFVYGGQPSTAFLGSWQRRVEEVEVDASRRCRTLTLTDPVTALEVRAVCTLYLDTPGVDWTLHFTNRGQADTPVLEAVRALDRRMRPGLGVAPVLHRLKGSTCAADDWMPFDTVVAPGERLDFGAVNGRSSAESPFFSLDWSTGGVVTAVGWSGQWRGTVEQAADGELRLQAGMQDVHLKLRPGETIRSPRILQLHWTGASAERGTNLCRQTLLRHIVPAQDGAPVPPPIAHLSTSFYEMNDSTEASVLSHLESIQGLGFEMFWLDAYWTRGGFPAGMGNYGFPLERVEPLDRFPHGLKAISAAVRRAGLGFLMWFEPERVHPGTALAREHPEWVISPAGDGSGLFNLGIPEARRFMTGYLSAAVREYGLSCLRIDFNIDPQPFWTFLNQQDSDRVGLAEIRYVEGLYQMWDDILAAAPGLFIDNCASGGRRLDLETCSRSLALWRSDNTCDMVGARPQAIQQAAIKNQVMSAGLNRYVPFSTVGQMGVTPYLFRSGFNAGIAFAEDCRPADYPRQQLALAIAEGKRLRPYWSGEVYTLSQVTLSPVDWCVLQYHLPAADAGLVVAFRRHESPYASFDCEPRQISAGVDYEVTQAQTFDPPAAPQTLKGAALQHLRLQIDDRPGSVIVEYRRAGR